MPEERLNVIVDNPDGKPPVAAAEIANPQDADKGTYLGAYKTRDDAEHGYKEMQARSTRAEQKAAELEREVAMLRDQTLAKLTKLEEARNTPAEAGGPTAEEIEAEEARIIEELSGENGPRAILKLHRTTAQMAMEAQRQIAEARKEAKAAAERAAALEAQFGEMRDSSDPVVQQNKAGIEKLMATGIFTRQQAVAAFRAIGIAPAGVAGPESRPTAGVGNPRPAPSEQVSAGVTAAEIAALEAKGIKMTPERIAILKKAYGRTA